MEKKSLPNYLLHNLEKFFVFFFQCQCSFVECEPVRYGPSVLKKARVCRSPVPHLITTVKDDPQRTDPKERLLQRNEPTCLKHRKAFIDNHSS